MVMKNKILILTSGKVSKLEGFNGGNLTKGSFDDVWFSSDNKNLMINEEDIKNFDLIYFRMVGKSLEIATLVANYAVKNGVKIVDKMYEKAHLMPLNLAKSIETKKLIEADIPMPKTVFGKFNHLPFPFIVKSTSSSRGREVWMVKNNEELENLKKEKFKKNKFYFCQELVPNAQRIRVLVVGDKCLGAIVRQTKWNKDETKDTLSPIPENVKQLALKTVNAAGLDICGIDILVNKKTNKVYVIEANAAPSWKLINKYCGIIVEDEIIKYLQKKI